MPQNSYRFRECKVGESFTITAVESTVRPYVSRRGKHYGRRFSVHKQPDGTYVVTRQE